MKSNMITIYVICHCRLEDTNLFTTHLSRVDELIVMMAHKTKTKISEWEVRTLVEKEEFCADMTNY